MGCDLTRTLKHAVLHRAKGPPGALDLFVNKELDALAGLRPWLNMNAENLPGVRVLDGCYLTVQQAIGTKPENTAAAAFLDALVAEAKESGLVARLIDRHSLKGRLQVASGG